MCSVARGLDVMGDGARRTVSWPARGPLPFLLAEVPRDMGPPGKELCFPALLASVHGQGKGVEGPDCSILCRLFP